MRVIIHRCAGDADSQRRVGSVQLFLRPACTYGVLLWVAAARWLAFADPNLETPSSSPYAERALVALLREANEVARSLGLPEHLPILARDLVADYVSPHSLATLVPGVGNISTTNYTYYVTVGNKFSYLQRRNPDSASQELEHLMAHYLWPTNRLDKEAAYQLATQWLHSVSIDVERLNRDCDFSVRAWTPEGKQGEHFVPLYWVCWGNDGRPIAMVELFEPTKTLRQLRVERSEYILRLPLTVGGETK